MGRSSLRYQRRRPHYPKQTKAAGKYELNKKQEVSIDDMENEKETVGDSDKVEESSHSYDYDLVVIGGGDLVASPVQKKQENLALK